MAACPVNPTRCQRGAKKSPWGLLAGAPGSAERLGNSTAAIRILMLSSTERAKPHRFRPGGNSTSVPPAVFGAVLLTLPGAATLSHSASGAGDADHRTTFVAIP